MSLNHMHWMPLIAPRCPRHWRDWLADQGSLTRRLQQRAGDSFEVVVLRQEWDRLRPDEARLLGQPTHPHALVREVLLRGRDRDWVYARSVIPRPAWTGGMRAIRLLGNRPLGEWLFRHPAVRRGPILVTRWPCGQLPLRCRPRDGRAPWARCSVFSRGPARLLVSEVFLPALAEPLPLE